jgi:hypothetical protein
MEEAIETPGAAISGFNTSSYLGPILEKEAIPPPTGFPLEAIYFDAYAATLSKLLVHEGSLIPY